MNVIQKQLQMIGDDTAIDVMLTVDIDELEVGLTFASEGLTCSLFGSIDAVDRMVNDGIDRCVNVGVLPGFVMGQRVRLIGEFDQLVSECWEQRVELSDSALAAETRRRWVELATISLVVGSLAALGIWLSF